MLYPNSQSMAPAIDIDHAYCWSDEPCLAYRTEAAHQAKRMKGGDQ